MKQTLFVVFPFDYGERMIYAFSQEQAVILVMAELIKEGKTHKIEAVKNKETGVLTYLNISICQQN